MIAEISAAFTSVKTAIDLAKAARDSDIARISGRNGAVRFAH